MQIPNPKSQTHSCGSILERLERVEQQQLRLSHDGALQQVKRARAAGQRVVVVVVMMMMC